MYRVGGMLLKAVQSFYVDSKVWLRIGNEVSEWFSENVGISQGCVMSPWSFNLYMDGVVREVQARTVGRGPQLVGDDQEKWEASQLLFADDTQCRWQTARRSWRGW